MKKRLISLIVAVVMLFSMLCPAAYADDETVSFDTCTHEWETPTRSGYTITIPGTDVSFSVKTEQCTKCKWYKHVATIIVAEFTYYSPLNVDANGLVPTELATYWANVWYNTFGKNATVTKAPSGIGRKDLPGYTDDYGTANIGQTGLLQFALDVCGAAHYNGGTVPRIFFNDYTSRNALSGSTSSYSNFGVTWSGVAPVWGVYYYTPNSSTDLGFVRVLSSGSIYNKPIRTGVDDVKDTNKYLVSRTYKAGQTIYFNSEFSFSSYVDYIVYAKPVILSVEPFEIVDVSNYKNITINNNTWNGNIYVDGSTNLTYIYPEYTTINENNETVTNISTNPIIYNSETDQYYTYDQTTNNYYYITYVTTPTPTPSPSPTPEPSETPDVTPTPTPDNPDATPTPSPDIPTITPTPTPGGGSSGGGSGSGSNISGGSDEGLFGWLWDLLKDLVKAILKAIFKVLSGILGFLIWLVERVGLLFPFLPAPAVAALGAGVVLVFVIKIIRFIRG